jgi:hypothetical protein
VKSRLIRFWIARSLVQTQNSTRFFLSGQPLRAPPVQYNRLRLCRWPLDFLSFFSFGLSRVSLLLVCLIHHIRNGPVWIPYATNMDMTCSYDLTDAGTRAIPRRATPAHLLSLWDTTPLCPYSRHQVVSSISPRHDRYCANTALS